METVVNHSLKRSLETQNVNNTQTERTQIFTARGSEGTIILILPLVTNKATCMLISLDPPLLCFPFSLLPSSLLCFSDYCDCLTLWFLYHVSIPVFWVKYVIVSALQGQWSSLPLYSTSCRGKSCSIGDRCEDCHDWSDEKCRHVSEYLAKFSVQREKERKAKASSSSSFFGLSLPNACSPISSAIPSGFNCCNDNFIICCMCGDIFGCFTRCFRCALCSFTWCDTLGT